VVICLERGADLHIAQLMPMPLTVSCFSEIQIGFTFLLPAHPGSPGQRAVKRVCVCVVKDKQDPDVDNRVTWQSQRLRYDRRFVCVPWHNALIVKWRRFIVLFTIQSVTLRKCSYCH